MKIRDRIKGWMWKQTGPRAYEATMLASLLSLFLEIIESIIGLATLTLWMPGWSLRFMNLYMTHAEMTLHKELDGDAINWMDGR